jgi:proline iminopeptidase
MPIRDVSLFVDVVGHGYPLLLMHGGPSADHTTMLPFRRCADRFTLVFYDHRCNGRSVGAPVSSMTWENLTADADALRQKLGFDKWAVLGHSFGGHVALEYALRYPDNLSHLVLLDTGGDSRWSRQHAAGLLAERGYSPEKVELVRATPERQHRAVIGPRPAVHEHQRVAMSDDVDEEGHVSNRHRCHGPSPFSIWRCSYVTSVRI